MPARINAQLRAQGDAPLDESPAGAARIASLIFHSLAAAYALTLEELRRHTGLQPTEIVVVGGGCRNDLLCRLTAERTGLPVRRGAPESSTIGNLAVQLAALEDGSPANPDAFAAAVSSWAATLLHSTDPLQLHPRRRLYATPRTPEVRRSHCARTGSETARAPRTICDLHHRTIFHYLQHHMAARLRPRPRGSRSQRADPSALPWPGPHRRRRVRRHLAGVRPARVTRLLALPPRRRTQHPHDLLRLAA